MPQPVHTRAMGLGIHQVVAEPALSEYQGGIPDYARGRGGDGISAGVPIGGITTDVDDAVSVRQQQIDLLGKLERILGW